MELSVAVLFIKCYVYRTFSFLKPLICSLSYHLQMKMILSCFALMVLLGFRLPAESSAYPLLAVFSLALCAPAAA